MDINIKKLKKAKTALGTRLEDIPEGSVFAITYLEQPDGDWPSYRTDVYLLLKKNPNSQGTDSAPTCVLCVDLRKGALNKVSVDTIVDVIDNPALISED